MTNTTPESPRPENPLDALAKALYDDARAHNHRMVESWDSLFPAEKGAWIKRAITIRDALGGALRESFPDPVNSRGFDAAADIPVGATVTRVYFCEPGMYTAAADNAEHDTYEAALEAAIARHEEAERKHREFYDDARRGSTYLPLPERFSIDVRWSMTYPVRSTAAPAGGLDTMAKRTTYDTLDDGRAHLERIRRFSAITAGART